MAKETARSSTEPENNDELEQITIARALLNYRLKEKISMSNSNAPVPFPKKFQIQNPRPTSPQPPPAATSKILPLIFQIKLNQTCTKSIEECPTCSHLSCLPIIFNYIPEAQAFFGQTSFPFGGQSSLYY